MLPLEGYSHRKQENVNKKPHKGFLFGEKRGRGEGGKGVERRRAFVWWKVCVLMEAFFLCIL